MCVYVLYRERGEKKWRGEKNEKIRVKKGTRKDSGDKGILFTEGRVCTRS